MQRVLNWKPNFDKKSKGFGVEGLLGSYKNSSKSSKIWKHGKVLDQGSEGACVGFAVTGATIANPLPPVKTVTTKEANRFAFDLYAEAQTLDPWPGEDYNGTSVLAGAKAARSRGIIDEYRWCFSVDQLKDAIINIGPAVVGVNWYSDMYHTDIDGLVHVSGDLVGGHAILVTGFINDFDVAGTPTPVFQWVNSWGVDYGKKGKGYITYEDMKSLIDMRAEVCIPIKKNRPVLFGPNPEPIGDLVEPAKDKDVIKPSKDMFININLTQIAEFFSGLIKIINNILKGKNK